MTKSTTKLTAPAGWIYQVEAQGTGWCKVGRTSGPVDKRVKSLATTSPHDLRLVQRWMTDDAPYVEGILHRILSALDDVEQNREWFLIDSPSLTTIIDNPAVLCHACGCGERWLPAARIKLYFDWFESESV